MAIVENLEILIKKVKDGQVVFAKSYDVTERLKTV